MMDDFLEIFKHSFHKLSLVGVRELGKCKSPVGREYYRFAGKFEFVPPRQTFNADLKRNKAETLKEFRRLPETESNCFERKFTKKVILNGKLKKKITFTYVFDVVPRNIIGFDIDRKNGKMYLYVLGYGVF